MPHFNPLVEKLSPPPIPSVLAWAKAYDGAKGPLIDLSQAVPGYPAHPDMLKWLGEAAASTAYTGYGAIEGEAELRQAYAEHVAALYGGAIAAGNIHITSGCNQAFICAAMAVAGAGDTVLMTNPYYFNQETTLAMLGIDVELAPLDAGAGFLPEVETIASALRPGIRALALVSPNNPTGAVYPPGLLQRIYELCRANGTWLILDETIATSCRMRPPRRMACFERRAGRTVSSASTASRSPSAFRAIVSARSPPDRRWSSRSPRSWTISRSAPRVPRRRRSRGRYRRLPTGGLPTAPKSPPAPRR